MIWLKRISPFLLIVLVWFGWTRYSRYRDERQNTEDLRMAQLSARIWVAGAKYRTDSQQYIKYRDSLLGANGLSDVSMKAYVKSIEKQVDRQLQFSTLVYRGVDSLVKIEDSLRKAATDSVEKAADTVAHYHVIPPKSPAKTDSNTAAVQAIPRQ